ncbi:unnamed protein product, partial [Pocillopora meandrina]
IKTEQNSSPGLYNMTWATQARCQASSKYVVSPKDMMISLFSLESSREVFFFN